MQKTAVNNRPDLQTLLSPVSLELLQVEARINAAIETDLPPLSEAYRSLFSGGKRVRPAISLLCAGPANAAKPQVIALGASLEMLHTATLIHDDIIDRSPLRRGKPTISALHGEEVAILAGDHLLATAATVVTETEHIEALRIFANALVTISKGELMQNWRVNTTPSMDVYLQLIYAKTACLFETAALGGALISGKNADEVRRFGDYGRYLGLAFQIADDVLDYVGSPELMGKPTWGDFQRGLLTLPLLLRLWQVAKSEDSSSRDILAEQDAPKLAEFLRQHGYVQKALDMAQEYSNRAWDSISGLVEGSFADSLAGLAHFAVNRAL